MRIVRIAVRVVVFVGIILFLDYCLPARDKVRIVGTEVVRTDVDKWSIFWASDQSAVDTAGNRDVRFINTVFADGDSRVYRNEDTGWNFPFYFKFDSGNLQAEAQSLAAGSTSGTETWVAVTHYGWRSTLLSIYPNATSIKLLSGPQETLINWIRIIGFILAAILLLVIWRLWVRLKEWFLNQFDSVRTRVTGWFRKT